MSQPTRHKPLPYRMLAGVVPVRNGWLVQAGRLQGVTMYPVAPAVLPLLEDVLDWKPAFDCVAIHVPLGLPLVGARGGRTCEREARLLLGYPRSLSIASAPSRRSLKAITREEARELNNGFSVPWHSMPKIAEAARAVASYNQRIVHEIHPELSFFELNGGVPLSYSKHKAEGRGERRELLVTKVQNMANVIDARIKGPTRAKQLDACVALWSARRIAAKGAAIRLPLVPEWDEEGLRMEMWR